MKNKKYVPYLAIVAIAVWGVIIYRVFAGRGGDDDQVITNAPAPVKKEMYNDYEVAKDTTKLNLKYQDPFGQKKQIDTVSPKKIVISVAKNKPITANFNWGNIRYAGYIRNPQSKKLLAIISINGKTLSLAEGETAENLKLIKNLQDSVKVMFGGKTTYLTLKPGSL